MLGSSSVIAAGGAVSRGRVEEEVEGASAKGGASGEREVMIEDGSALEGGGKAAEVERPVTGEAGVMLMAGRRGVNAAEPGRESCGMECATPAPNLCRRERSSALEKVKESPVRPGIWAASVGTVGGAEGTPKKAAGGGGCKGGGTAEGTPEKAAGGGGCKGSCVIGLTWWPR